MEKIKIIEAEVLHLDHIHMLVEIPPKMSVAGFVGYLKRKKQFDNTSKAWEFKI